MPPPETTKRAVWVRSGGRCAICREVLCVGGISNALNHFIGDVAHIVAERPDGPRGYSPLSVEQRNLEANLLLLCLTHHKIIDDDSATYTAEKLHQLKDKHYDWVASSLSLNPVWDTRLFHLYYINVPRLSLLAALKGVTLDLSSYGRIDALHELGWELNGVMAGFTRLLQTIELNATPLDSALGTPDMRGLIVSFDHEFRTKNIELPEVGRTFDTSFTGNAHKDPHIYRHSHNYKIIANIDRRWITTTTAFCQFRPSSGRNRFAGLGFINLLDDEAKIAYLTPYVIGMPSNPLMEAFYGDSF